jgi:hypothetical protein
MESDVEDANILDANISDANISRVFKIFFDTSKETGNTFEDRVIAQKELLAHIRTMDRETFIDVFEGMIEDGLPIIWLYDQIRSPPRMS